MANNPPRRVRVRDSSRTVGFVTIPPPNGTLVGNVRLHYGEVQADLYRLADGRFIRHLWSDKPEGIGKVVGKVAWLLTPRQAAEWLAENHLPIPRDMEHLFGGEDLDLASAPVGAANPPPEDLERATDRPPSAPLRMEAPDAPRQGPDTPADVPYANGDVQPAVGREPHGHKLEFYPGGFRYKGHEQPLTSIPLRLLRAFAAARHNTLTVNDCLNTWGHTRVSVDTVRSHVRTLRAALVAAVQAAGDQAPDDPIPIIEQGGGQTAWRLQLP